MDDGKDPKYDSTSEDDLMSTDENNEVESEEGSESEDEEDEDWMESEEGGERTRIPPIRHG